MPAHNARFCGMVNVHWGGGVRPAPVCTTAETGVLVSSSCYHGYERVPQTLAPVSNHVSMELDCDASAAAHSTPPVVSRKRSGDDSEAPRVKRLREEQSVPSTSKYNPYLVGPTHTNPDVSRCLMVHMI